MFGCYCCILVGRRRQVCLCGAGERVCILNSTEHEQLVVEPGKGAERGGGGSFAAPSPTFLLKKLKSGVSPPQKKSVPTALHKPQNLESFLQNLYYTRKVFLTHQCPHLFAGRHCQDEDDMKKIVEEFHRDFTRTHNRLKKKARALIKLRQKQSKSGGYVINPMYDTQSASLW